MNLFSHCVRCSRSSVFVVNKIFNMVVKRNILNICAIQKLLNSRINMSLVASTKCLSDQACSTSPLKTSLYDFHANKGGKLVNFAGFYLPVQYSDLSLSASHLHTRKNASIFDVSHMLQTSVSGKDSIEWFESMCPVDLKNMPNGSASLTVFLNDKGGILDDLIVTRLDENNLYVVSNAGRLEFDKEHMSRNLKEFKKKGKDVSVQFYNVTEKSLIAVQGPKAVESLQKLTKFDLGNLYFMNSILTTVAGIENCRITRCGYTGEDGVEISMPADKAVHIAEALLENDDVKLAGLGARDSLRLEAGLCLYGNDIDSKVTPVEANLTWLIAKNRRAEGNFPGAENILYQIRNGVMKRRVGLRMEKGPPARKEALLKHPSTEEVIGEVTSGCPSPSLGGSVAMGYVKESLKKVNTPLVVNIRGKDVPCVVAKMPFVPAHYYTKK